MFGRLPWGNTGSGFPFGHTSLSTKQNFVAKGLTFRHNMYPSYKSNRSPTPDTIVQALQFLKASLKAMSVKVIEVPGVEADDVIGTLAVRSVDVGFKVRVVSPDKDFFQILSPSLRLLRIAPRGFKMVSFGMEDFAGKYGGLKPSQFIDLTSLIGDKSDNIPGVHGIGDVHAIQLIIKFGTLENLLECVEQVEEERIRKVISANSLLCSILLLLVVAHHMRFTISNHPFINMSIQIASSRGSPVQICHPRVLLRNSSCT
ncbi:hypothetical protein HAX54_028428 [Datura stramonium]|uniref:5'-3' exonuclease domain-containing protein n=1 Tax=Datura stramonium TaxID=4076 RepID=A0ABS8V6H1_DATST|nr:hypothetical protein [Datura stramonium]